MNITHFALISSYPPDFYPAHFFDIRLGRYSAYAAVDVFIRPDFPRNALLHPQTGLFFTNDFRLPVWAVFSGLLQLADVARRRH